MNELFPQSDMEQLSPYLAFVRRHGIWTHDAPHMDRETRWCAMAVDLVKKQIGRELTDEEKAEPVAMIATYAGWLDDNGFLEYGPTEREAVFNLAKALKLEGWEGVDWE